MRFRAKGNNSVTIASSSSGLVRTSFLRRDPPRWPRKPPADALEPYLRDDPEYRDVSEKDWTGDPVENVVVVPL
jgi:hypothetical protein